MSAALHAAETLARLAEEGCALAAEGRLESLEAQEPAWRRKRSAPSYSITTSWTGDAVITAASRYAWGLA